MYKVFFNEQVIILTDGYGLDLIGPRMIYIQYDDFEEINFVLSIVEARSDLSGVVIQCEELDELWADFRAHFREIDAAGGLVTTPEGELLMIHRFGKWDLPKGKRESDEAIEQCAVREVIEECGINNVHIVAPLPDTYHVYQQRGIRYLKRTFWYRMQTVKQKLRPQTEEGILEARWMALDQIDWHTMPSYPNIRMLLDIYRGAS